MTTDRFTATALKMLTLREKQAILDIIGNQAQVAVFAAEFIAQHPEQWEENEIRARSISRVIERMVEDVRELLGVSTQGDVRAAVAQMKASDSHLGAIRE